VKGKEVAGKVDVGKVAEKVVKNVRLSISSSFVASFSLYSLHARSHLLVVVRGPG